MKGKKINKFTLVWKRKTLPQVVMIVKEMGGRDVSEWKIITRREEKTGNKSWMSMTAESGKGKWKWKFYKQ